MLMFATRFVREEEGATMVEYGFMVAFIALACVGAVTTLGQSLVPFFTDVNIVLTP